MCFLPAAAVELQAEPDDRPQVRVCSSRSVQEHDFRGQSQMHHTSTVGKHNQQKKKFTIGGDRICSVVGLKV